MKDFYQVLQVSPSATQEEIKKAFRRLALRYHPDKNSSPDAALHYQQIQEAWQTLKDRHTRAAYNYKRYINTPKQSRPVAGSIEELLQLSAAFQRKIGGLDPFRADLDLISFEAADLLSPAHLELALNNKPASDLFLEQILSSLTVLPFPMLDSLLPKLSKLAENDAAAAARLKDFVRQARIGYFWSRYKIVLALAVAAVFCLLLLLVR
ncbi:MAG: J domain-containing protein [Chitinophagaceae bacterium]|nr:J domain-containing protein [Chitinophagaceae bacterium]